MSSTETPMMIEVEPAICSEYCTIAPTTFLSEAIFKMSQTQGNYCDISSPKKKENYIPTRQHISCALVVENDQLIGILTERDLVKLVNTKATFQNTKVKDVMTSPVISLKVEEFTDLFMAYNLMRRHRFRHLPLVNQQNSPVGVVTLGSLRQAFHLGYFLRFRQAEEIMTHQVICANISTSVGELANIMTTQRVSCVVVVENQNNLPIPVGIVTERDIVQFQAMELNLEQLKTEKIMSQPIFSVKPDDSVVIVHQCMTELKIRRLVVTGKNGELLGIITESNLSQLLDPIEIYGILEIFRRRVSQLEKDKAILLQGKGLELQKALENNEFCLYYQPQVNIKTGKIIGVEALVRWLSPEKGMIPPNQFIPVAENTDFIIPLGKWILDQACFQIKQWQELNLPIIPISVNISPRQFCQTDLVTYIKEIIDKTEIDPCYLKLELTESLLVEDVEITLDQFKKLKALGISIAIDDFGTGYASLGYLQHFPFNSLKLDRSFVQNIHQNTKNAAITTAIIKMAHQLDFEVIAEGVETKEECDFLLTHGCKIIQGYLISQPLPITKFNKFMLNFNYFSNSEKSI